MQHTHTHPRTNAHSCMHTQNTHTNKQNIHTHIPAKKGHQRDSLSMIHCKNTEACEKRDSNYKKRKKTGFELKIAAKKLEREIQKELCRSCWSYMSDMFTPTDSEEKSEPCLKRFSWTAEHQHWATAGIPALKASGPLATDPIPKAESRTRRLDSLSVKVRPLLVKGSAVNAPCLMLAVNRHLRRWSQLEHKAQQSSWSTWAPVKLLDQLAFAPRKSVSNLVFCAQSTIMVISGQDTSLSHSKC